MKHIIISKNNIKKTAVSIYNKLLIINDHLENITSEMQFFFLMDKIQRKILCFQSLISSSLLNSKRKKRLDLEKNNPSCDPLITFFEYSFFRKRKRINKNRPEI